MYKLENEKLILVNEETQETYKEKRIMEYPSISEQLDMLYHDKQNGTNFWEEKISEIKNKYPKV